ncbi:unnamed protein product [Brassica oleracea var. botrytis]
MYLLKAFEGCKLCRKSGRQTIRFWEAWNVKKRG